MAPLVVRRVVALISRSFHCNSQRLVAPVRMVETGCREHAVFQLAVALDFRLEAVANRKERFLVALADDAHLSVLLDARRSEAASLRMTQASEGHDRPEQSKFRVGCVVENFFNLVGSPERLGAFRNLGERHVAERVVVAQVVNLSRPLAELACAAHHFVLGLGRVPFGKPHRPVRRLFGIEAHERLDAVCVKPFPECLESVLVSEVGLGVVALGRRDGIQELRERLVEAPVLRHELAADFLGHEPGRVHHVQPFLCVALALGFKAYVGELAILRDSPVPCKVAAVLVPLRYAVAFHTNKSTKICLKVGSQKAHKCLTSYPIFGGFFRLSGKTITSDGEPRQTVQIAPEALILLMKKARRLLPSGFQWSTF